MDKHAYISKMFSSIARRYDLSNTILSFGLDNRWRNILVKKADLKPGDRVIDVATGTGKLAGKMALAVGKSNVFGIDFCQEMLEVACEKYREIAFIRSLAEALPFNDNTFDCAATSFTLRNMPDVETLFKEMTRVVKGGGKIAVLELSKPRTRCLNSFHLFYLKRVVPYIGGIITGRRDVYGYLTQSINDFRRPEEVIEVMKKTGLTDVRIYPLTFQTAVIYIGIKGADVGKTNSVSPKTTIDAANNFNC